MTCLEAQSNIMAFIDRKLPDEKAREFVRHVRYCKNCREELEIYYTLLVGMRQLDSGAELSQDFKKDLEGELVRIENRARKARRFRMSAFSFVFMLFVAAFLAFYNSCLIRVYNSEQQIKKTAQGSTYFYDYYSSYIDLAQEDIVSVKRKETVKKEETPFEKIHWYRLMHPILKKESGETETEEEESTAEEETTEEESTTETKILVIDEGVYF